MLSFDEFNQEINLINSLEKRMTSFGINGSTFAENVFELFDLFIKSHFTDEGISLIYWWMYEDVEKIIYETKEVDLFNRTPENIEIDVKSQEDLWNYMYKNKEIYFK